MTAMTSLSLSRDDYNGRTAIAVRQPIAAESTESHRFLLAVFDEFTERFEFFFSDKNLRFSGIYIYVYIIF